MLTWMRKALGRALGSPAKTGVEDRHDRFMRRCLGAPEGRLFPRDRDGRFVVVMRPREDKAKAIL